jgi:hypothetical protein
MIISVHLPKTAGKSFEAALQTRFGASLLEDYSDFPMNTPKYERTRAAIQQSLINAAAGFPGVECIHGHFLPVKYLLMAERRAITFITWMRDPVQRLLSNYFYWRRTYEPATAQRLHRRVVEEDWSLERFCLGAEMRDMYAEFLWGFPVDNFAFIGVTEFYDEDLAYFARRFLGITVEPQRLNVGEAEGRQYELDGALRLEIEKVHKRDVELYRMALRRRLTRPATDLQTG